MIGADPGGQGTRDAATFLPFLALILFAPPIVLIFAAPLSLGGVPLILLYLFGVWTVIIAAAFVIARRLDARGPSPDDEQQATDKAGQP